MNPSTAVSAKAWTIVLNVMVGESSWRVTQRVTLAVDGRPDQLPRDGLDRAMQIPPHAQEPPIQSLSFVEIVYCCVVMVLAYAARGSTGFGAAAAMPLLGLVIPLKVLIPAWTVIGAAAGVALFGGDRHRIAWGEMAKLVPTLLLGIAVGL